MKTVLLTGGTGAVGRYVLEQFANLGHEEFDMILLGRSGNSGIRLSNSRYICVDLTNGELFDNALGREVRNVTHVIHLAADVRWNLAEKDSMDINYQGTKHLVDFVKKYCPKLEKFIHVSTAFTSAPKSCDSCSCFMEYEGKYLNNSYEYSKLLSELYIRDCGLPWVIVKPSLVVGNQFDGRIDKFNGIYHLVKTFARGLLPFIVGNPKGYLDIVPVDIVAKAIIESMDMDEYVGKSVFCISSNNAPTVKSIVDISIERINDYRVSNNVDRIAKPSILDCDAYNRLYYPLIKDNVRGAHISLLDYLNVFHPYVSISEIFPMAPEDNTVLYQSPEYVSYLGKAVDSWCHMNPFIALSRPYSWSSRIKIN